MKLDKKDKNVIMLMTDISKMFHVKLKARVNDDSKMVTYRPILKVLNHHNGCNQLDIVNYTLLKAPTISLTLKNMELDGLIERKPNPNDKRNMNIFITEKGMEANEKVHKAAEEIKDIILDELNEEELANLKDVLLKILDKVEEI